MPTDKTVDGNMMCVRNKFDRTDPSGRARFEFSAFYSMEPYVQDMDTTFGASVERPKAEYEWVEGEGFIDYNGNGADGDMMLQYES